MDVVEKMGDAPSGSEAGPSFLEELRAYWVKLPDKGLYVGLLAGWCLLFHFFGISFGNFGTTSPSLFCWMYAGWNDPVMDSSQGELIPLVVVILLWIRRKEFAAAVSAAWWPALVLVALASVVHILGFFSQQPRISMAALVLGLYSFVGLTWGWRTMRVSLFPFALFAFAMPLGPVLDPWTLPLRLVTTNLAALICRDWLSIPLMHQGTALYDPTGKFSYDVAAACSGSRSFTALLAVTTIFSFLTFKPAWKRCVMVALTVPLVIVCNVLRLVVVVLVSQAYGQESGKWVHGWFWVVTYSVAIVSLLIVAHWLKDKPQPVKP